MDIMQRIKEIVENNHIVLFMKGSPASPQCGFSLKTVELLNACNTEFHHVDVLAEPEIRQNLPKFSNWPTFPQVFVDGELVGGCDILVDLFQRGELQQLTQRAVVD